MTSARTCWVSTTRTCRTRKSNGSIGLPAEGIMHACVTSIMSLVICFASAAYAGNPPEKPVEKGADNTPPAGFIALFNGKDLTNWKGLLKPENKKRLDNPAVRAT